MMGIEAVLADSVFFQGAEKFVEFNHSMWYFPPFST